MIAVAGDGPMAIAVMWIMTVIILVFVVLRGYTRLIVVHSYGLDDHVYNAAFIMFVMYSIFITVSSLHGFGQNLSDIKDQKEIPRAILYEAIGQIFAVLGSAVAKCSLGLFLCRLVEKTWHVATLWAVMFILMSTSIMEVFCFMLQCHPIKFLWDRTIEGGYCDLPMTPLSILYGTSGVFGDFFFALFPWIFIWKLKMNQREKLIILCSMSLGLIAGAFGIKRSLEVPNLSKANYLKATVGLILWSAAEQCVTMVCIGIPVCRPLYKRYLDRFTSSGSHGNRYQKQGSGIDANGVPLRTFGGGTMPGNPTDDGEDGIHDLSRRVDGKNGGLVSTQETSPRREHIIGSQISKAFAIATSGRNRSDISSDEEVLADDFGRQQRQHNRRTSSRDEFDDRLRNIHVTEEFSVTTDRLDRA